MKIRDESSISELEFLLGEMGNFDVDDIDEAACEVFGEDFKVVIKITEDNIYKLSIKGFATQILLREIEDNRWCLVNV